MSSPKKVNRESKNIFARLLATEDITIRHDPSLDTAYFDTNKRILALPVLDNMDDDVYDLFVGHEVGHALFTPAFNEEDMLRKMREVNEKNPYVAKMCLNMVEDARIEKAMRKKYPGLSKSFRAGYSKLWELGFFGEDSKEIREKFSELVIIDRLNLHYKGTIYGIQNFELSELDQSFVDRIDQAKTFDDIIPICIDILKHMEIPEKEEEKQEETEQQVNVSSSSGSGNVEEEETKSGEDSEGNEEESSTNSGEGSSSAGLNYKESTSFNQPKEKPKTDENDALSKYVQEVNKKSNKNVEYYYNNIPEPNLKRIIVPYKVILEDFVRLFDEEIYHDNKTSDYSVQESYNFDTEYKNFLAKNKSICHSMSMCFKRKQQADVFRRTQISKTGRLNMDLIHTYRYNDDLFKSANIVPNGKNHGIIMYLDWSGSMSSNISETIEQLMSLVLFCRKSGIKYQVFAFTDNAFDINSNESFWENESETTYRFSGFHLLDLFNSEMNNKEHDIAMKGMVFLSNYLGYKKRLGFRNFSRFLEYFKKYNLSGTPLNETIIAAIDIEKNFQRKHNCQIMNTVFLTDGESGGLGFSYPSGYSWSYSTKKKQYLEYKSKTYDIDHYYGNSIKFMEIFKDNTNSRLIGIYLTYGVSAVARNIARQAPDDPRDFDKNIMEEAAKNFKKNSYAEIPNDPYDFYYIMKSNAEAIGFDDVFDGIDASKKNTQIITQFVKNIKKRSCSRIVLNTFAEVVAKDFER